MKLRLQGNSVRLRLTRSEVQRLRESGAVEEAVDFGGDLLTYRVQTIPHPDPVQARFKDCAVTVLLGQGAADAWAGSEEVGIYARVGGLVISVEKDFRCLTRPLDDQERDAYPHPGQLEQI